VERDISQTSALPRHRRVVPLWLKLSYTLFVLVLIPVYWVHYGPQNFLWFSDIALFGAGLALWLEDRLIPGMMLLAVGLPEIAWNIDFFYQLITGNTIIGLADYMFESDRPRYLRALSLFHVFMPVILIWLVHRLGYDRRALPLQTLLAMVVLPLTYVISTPEENINWVYGPGDEPQQWVHPLLYLLGLMMFFPLVIYLPTHLLLNWWRGKHRRRPAAHGT
jgi:hypothetical protein